ncbi:serine/threonine protein kinase [Bifidobacterium sp. ESL0745]|uniref:serine/threonine protein kinase n=1 Tax=Bifidobacterium sp. ESL0745 TaxID=2983226 RepID=UPI0023F7B6D6|nr:serine/threonine protein kinase [Bifidobacterium sp. ESL0745]MDF7666026.1 protein kinase [Bifidobacterium sp. ESL0745]
MSDLNALDLEPGEIVGGYTLISRLGGGAMGSVWRVRDDGGQVYAMKILRDSLKDDSETGGENYNTGDENGNYNNTNNPYANNSGEESSNPAAQHHHHSHDPHVTARERMRREAVAMRKIHHPGVCAIVDMELDDSLAFIVTELIEGKNLRDDVAANGRYVGDDLQRLAAKLIDAVRAVHAQGIIHRDIKPTNVMVSASGPVLVDFGIAMTAGESHVTRTGLVMGTPGFIAPEIIDGAESNEATDWWSLASVIAFAATGRPVFGSKPMMAVLEREASGNANLSGLPSNTREALSRALDPDPAKRCSPDELLKAITLDALNPFENGELDDDGSGTIGIINNGATGLNSGLGNSYGNGDSGSDNNSYGGNSANKANRNNHNGIDNSTQAAMPPFGQILPRNRQSQFQSSSSATNTDIPSNPRASWTDDIPTFAAPDSQADAEPAARQPRQIRGSTRAMPVASAASAQAGTSNGLCGHNQPSTKPAIRGTAASSEEATETLPAPSLQDLTATSAVTQNSRDDGGATATLPLDTAPAQNLDPTSPLPASALSATQAAEDGTMPLALAPTTQMQQPGLSRQQAQPTPYDANAPYIYGQSSAQAESLPQSTLQASEPAENFANLESPANARRGKLLSRSILPLCLLTIPLALLSATIPVVSICCAIVLIWFFLTLGYSEEAQLDREARHNGIRKGGDVALRAVSLPWHLVEALLFTIPRALLLFVIAGVGPVVVNLVSGFPTHMVTLAIGSWHMPLPLPADFSLSYSSLSLAIFMVVAWLLTVFGPKTKVLRIGAGRLRGAHYPAESHTPQRKTSLLGQGGQGGNEYLGSADEADDTDEAGDFDGGNAKKRHHTGRWTLWAIWAIVTILALVLLLSNHQINWIPLPTPQL